VAFGLRLCTEERRLVIDGMDTYASPDDDELAICRHCDKETTPEVGTAYVSAEYREIFYPWVRGPF
jgi:hypothetical protein